jgi:hypothetical protein
MLTPTKGFVPGHGRRAYMVYADVNARNYAFECSKLKRDVILCCHILKIMTQLNIEKIPFSYLLSIWSNEAGVIATPPATNESQVPFESLVENKGMMLNQMQPLKTIRYVDMCNEFASTSEKATGIVRKHMEGIKVEVTSFKLKNSKKQKAIAAEETTSKVNDPPLYKSKGWPISARRKPDINLEGAPTIQFVGFVVQKSTWPTNVTTS